MWVSAQLSSVHVYNFMCCVLCGVSCVVCPVWCVLYGASGAGWSGVVQAAGVTGRQPGSGEGHQTQQRLWGHLTLRREVTHCFCVSFHHRSELLFPVGLLTATTSANCPSGYDRLCRHTRSLVSSRETSLSSSGTLRNRSTSYVQFSKF